jgi:hypothetical protein
MCIGTLRKRTEPKMIFDKQMLRKVGDPYFLQLSKLQTRDTMSIDVLCKEMLLVFLPGFWCFFP